MPNIPAPSRIEIQESSGQNGISRVRVLWQIDPENSNVVMGSTKKEYSGKIVFAAAKPNGNYGRFDAVAEDYSGLDVLAGSLRGKDTSQLVYVPEEKLGAVCGSQLNFKVTAQGITAGELYLFIK